MNISISNKHKTIELIDANNNTILALCSCVDNKVVIEYAKLITPSLEIVLGDEERLTIQYQFQDKLLEKTDNH